MPSSSASTPHFNSRPPAAPPRLVCPECSHPSTLAELLAALVLPPLVQCPRCQIGSPAEQWTAPPLPPGSAAEILARLQ